MYNNSGGEARLNLYILFRIIKIRLGGGLALAAQGELARIYLKPMANPVAISGIDLHCCNCDNSTDRVFIPGVVTASAGQLNETGDQNRCHS